MSKILKFKCETCRGEGWVCENHPDQPWDFGNAKCCGGAGKPCPKCNPCDRDNPPNMGPGFETIGEVE